MQDDTRSRYQFSSWRHKEADSLSTLFVAFSPTKEDCFGWDLVMTCPHECGEDSRLFRTIWQNPVSNDSTVLVDVYTTPSDSTALDCLSDILSRNHLRILPPGPEDLGDKSFAYPEAVPDYLCWARDNLCVVTSSFGKEVVRVDELARRLDARLVESSEAAESCLDLRVDKSPILVGTEAKILYSLPWQIDDSIYLKFVASGAELFLKEQSIRIRPTESGEARIAGFAYQPGQAPCRGDAVITIV